MRRLERSGSRRKAALREFRRGLVFQRGVQPAMVVVVTMLLAEDFGYQERAEAFPIQKLVPQSAVEAFAVGILPRAAAVTRLDPRARIQDALYRAWHVPLGECISQHREFIVF